MPVIMSSIMSILQSYSVDYQTIKDELRSILGQQRVIFEGVTSHPLGGGEGLRRTDDRRACFVNARANANTIRRSLRQIARRRRSSW
jgi:hypothetical protein